MRKFLKSLAYAWKGFQIVWKEEKNFQTQVLIAFIVVILCILLKFSYLEFCIIILAITIVLAAEAINTVLEDALNKLEPNNDPIIGKIKDISAFFVTLTVIGAVIIGLIMFGHHI